MENNNKTCAGCKHNTYHNPVDYIQPVSWCMLNDTLEVNGCEDYDEVDDPLDDL